MPYRSARPVVAWHVLVLLGGLLLLAWSESARGVEIHKCATRAGLVYQDAPCPRGAATLPTPPLVPARGLTPIASPVRAAAPQAEAPPDPLPIRSVRVASPPPPLYRCERYDGQERYVTEEATPRRYQVPLWAVVGDAGAAGGAYTWVEDRCAPMSAREQCAHWDMRRDAIAQRRRLAFRDELGRLDAELAGLRERIAAHCA